MNMNKVTQSYLHILKLKTDGPKFLAWLKTIQTYAEESNLLEWLQMSPNGCIWAKVDRVYPY